MVHYMRLSLIPALLFATQTFCTGPQAFAEAMITSWKKADVGEKTKLKAMLGATYHQLEKTAQPAIVKGATKAGIIAAATDFDAYKGDGAAAGYPMKDKAGKDLPLSQQVATLFSGDKTLGHGGAVVTKIVASAEDNAQKTAAVNALDTAAKAIKASIKP